MFSETRLLALLLPDVLQVDSRVETPKVKFYRLLEPKLTSE